MGSGSGLRAKRKIQVEECRVMSIPQLVKRYLLDDLPCSASVVWPDTSFSVHYRMKSLDEDTLIAGLRYEIWMGQSVEKQDYIIRLRATRPNYGGRRWWFECPACGRRCFKMYLPPGARIFACRGCYDLTYRSAQEANSYNDGKWAGMFGIPTRQYRRLRREASRWFLFRHTPMISNKPVVMHTNQKSQKWDNNM